MRFTPRGQVAAVLLGAGLLAAVLALHPPVEGSFFPPCPVHVLTGLHCPGCGSTRALGAVVDGEFTRAFRHNALAITFLASVLPWAAWQAWLGLRHDRFATFTLSRRAGRAIVWTVVLFAALRNLPWPPFCWLAPA